MVSLSDTRVFLRALTLGLLMAGVSAVAHAQLLSGSSTTFPKQKVIETRVTEWDLPLGADRQPGAMSVDLQSNGGSRAWFVTRIGAPPRVHSLDVGRNFKSGAARWSSWTLHPQFPGPVGGIKKLKPSHDRRFAFVRTSFAVHKVDTATNLVTAYPDGGTDLISDIAVDNNNRVFWAAGGTIKRLNANAPCAKGAACAFAEVVVWAVGGTVGECAIGAFSEATDPCLSGVSVNSKSQHLVYFSDNGANEIGELDTNSKICSTSGVCESKVRRWSLTGLDDPSVNQPRQLHVDRDGTVWVITGSAHLVNLDPKYNRITTHKIPTGALNDPFGIAPDGGMIGYTDIAEDTTLAAGPLTDTQLHKVAMLIPRGKGEPVYPVSTKAVRETQPVEPNTVDSFFESKLVYPKRRTVPTPVTDNAEGIFVEALVNRNSDYEMRHSRFPLGITPDFDRSTGAFFYAVGEAPDALEVKRIGHARLSREKQRGKHDRDDEDIDDDGKNRGHDDDDDDDGWHNDVDDDDDNDGDKDVYDDDHDNDGIKNQYDTKTDKESQDNHSSQLSAAQAQEFQMTAGASTLAMIVMAVPDNLLVPISVEVRNPAGVVVANTLPAPGATVIPVTPSGAGIYTVRVKNAGTSALGIATTLLVRDQRLPQ